jgi:arylsulfatase A-like enzyme
MMRIPGVAPREIRVPRSGIDVAPTIAALLGVQQPASWRGVSLTRDLLPGGPAERTVIVDAPEMTLRHALRAVIDGNVKVVFAPGGARVFDLRADPGERSALEGPEADADVKRATDEAAKIEPAEATPCTQQAPQGGAPGGKI